MDPPEGPLHQAPYNTPSDVASDPRSLVQVAEETYPLLQKCPSANRMREHRNNNARRLLWALLRIGDHRLPKRPMSGELENAGKRGPGGRRKNGRAAWQRIFGYLASRGTGTLLHLTLGPGIAQCVTGAVGL